MTEAADHVGRGCSRRPRRTLSEMLGEVRSRPVSPDDFDRPNGFDSDEEVEEFLAWLGASRRADHV
jgi:hypothetical protein